MSSAHHTAFSFRIPESSDNDKAGTVTDMTKQEKSDN